MNRFRSKDSLERLPEDCLGLDPQQVADAFADLRHTQLRLCQSKQDPVGLYGARDVDGLATAIAQVHDKFLVFFRQTLAPCKRIQRARVAKVSWALVVAR